MNTLGNCTRYISYIGIGIAMCVPVGCDSRSGSDQDADINDLMALQVSPRIESQLNGFARLAGEQGGVVMIVRFSGVHRSTELRLQKSEGPEAVAQQRALIEQAQESFLVGLGKSEDPLVAKFKGSPFLGVKLREGDFKRFRSADYLSSDGRLFQVTIAGGRVVPFDMEPDSDLIEHGPSLGGLRPVLDSVLVHTQADLMHLEGIRGKGSVIVIIDDGVNDDYPHLGKDPSGSGISKVVAGSFFTASEVDECDNGDLSTTCDGIKYGRPLPGDPGGMPSHGTNVAIVAAGWHLQSANRDLKGTPGLAPEAQLISIRIEDSNSKRSMFDLARALEQVALQWSFDYPIAAVCVSLGSGSSFSACCKNVSGPKEDAVYSQIVALKEMGIPVVASAGNEQKPELPFPASLCATVAVASTGLPNVSSITSNWSHFVDFASPAIGLEVTNIEGQPFVPSMAGGSSLAAPQVAAAFALLRCKSAVYDPLAIETRLKVLSDAAVPHHMLNKDGVVMPRLRIHSAWKALKGLPCSSCLIAAARNSQDY